MPAVSLNQRSGALLELGVSAAAFLGSGEVPLLSFGRCGSSIFWLPQRAVRTRVSLVLGLSLSIYPFRFTTSRPTTLEYDS